MLREYFEKNKVPLRHPSECKIEEKLTLWVEALGMAEPLYTPDGCSHVGGEVAGDSCSYDILDSCLQISQ